MDKQIDTKSHYVAVTGIIIKDGKFLIAQRSEKEAAFPGCWTVPGGKLRSTDYTLRDRDTGDAWYYVLEDLLKREIKEEVNLEIKNIKYLLSLTYMRSDNIPTLVLSYYCEYASGKLKLSDELMDYKWVTVDELDQYELISGVQEEIEMVAKEIKDGKAGTWSRKHNTADEKSMRDG